MFPFGKPTAIGLRTFIWAFLFWTGKMKTKLNDFSKINEELKSITEDYINKPVSYKNPNAQKDNEKKHSTIRTKYLKQYRLLDKIIHIQDSYKSWYNEATIEFDLNGFEEFEFDKKETIILLENQINKLNQIIAQEQKNYLDQLINHVKVLAISYNVKTLTKNDKAKVIRFNSKVRELYKTYQHAIKKEIFIKTFCNIWNEHFKQKLEQHSNLRTENQIRKALDHLPKNK
jgi:hypothetical protein